MTKPHCPAPGDSDETPRGAAPSAAHDARREAAPRETQAMPATKAAPDPGEPVPEGSPAGAYWEVESILPPAGEALWSLFLFDRGATGAEILEETENRLRIRHFFDELDEATADGWPARFREAYPAALPPETVRAARKPREDWASAWQAHFAPLPIGRRLLIRPPWATGEDRPDWRGRLPLVIEPGQGFGTGRHPSTALVLELLEPVLEGPSRPTRVLDVGSGSGILAIAARLLGVGEAWAIDIDGRVIPEVRHNFRLNGLAAPNVLIRGGPRCLRGEAPLVVANLVTPVLLTECAALVRATASGGTLILSGILAPEREALAARYAESGCRLAETREREGWTALRLRRNP